MNMLITLENTYISQAIFRACSWNKCSFHRVFYRLFLLVLCCHLTPGHYLRQVGSPRSGGAPQQGEFQDHIPVHRQPMVDCVPSEDAEGVWHRTPDPPPATSVSSGMQALGLSFLTCQMGIKAAQTS